MTKKVRIKKVRTETNITALLLGIGIVPGWVRRKMSKRIRTPKSIFIYE